MEQVHYFGGWVQGAKSPWCQGFAGLQTYRTGGGARCIKVGTKVYKTGQTGTHTTSMLPISYQTTGNRLDLLNLVPLNFKLYRRWKSKNEVWGNFTVKIKYVVRPGYVHKLHPHLQNHQLRTWHQAEPHHVEVVQNMEKVEQTNTEEIFYFCLCHVTYVCKCTDLCHSKNSTSVNQKFSAMFVSK